jgi:hypothetical protein
MLWFTIWFMVILKIPIVYLAYIMWWAVKDPPAPGMDWASEGSDQGGDGPGWHPKPRRPLPGRHPGPHGAPVRRPAPLRARTAPRSRA